MKLFDNPDVQKNDRGHKLMESGSKEEGRRLLLEAAQAGQPNALASVIWYNVLNDEIDMAIFNFEKCLPMTGPWIQREANRINKLWLVTPQEKQGVIQHYQYQVSNSKSNAGLAYLAKGEESVAMKLWSEAAMNHGHLEARFYPLFQLCIQNPETAVGVLTGAFSKHELQALINDTKEVSSGKGWLANWANQGMNVLKTAAQNRQGGFNAKAASAAVGGGIFASKQFRDFVQDQVDEHIKDNENISDWFNDLF